MANLPEKKDPYSSLKIEEFRYFLTTRFLLTLAIQIQTLIVSWKLYEITNDVLSLGLIGLAEAIPGISVALFAGHVSDRRDRKMVGLFSVFSLFLLSICFLLLVGTNSLSPSLIYTIIFLTGLARGFIAPSFFSLLGQLVPKNLYANSSTWNSASWQLAAIAGPAMGGILYRLIGAYYNQLLVCLLFLGSILSFIRIKSKGRPPRGKDENLKESLMSGIRFVYKQPVILGALTLDLFAVLFGGVVAILPAFVKDLLSGGPEMLGLLRAAPSAGAVIGMILMAYYPPTEKAGKILLWAVAGFGICHLLFIFSSHLWICFFLLALAGGLDSISVIIRSVILQVLTPEEMRGRVSAVNTIFIGSSNEIGAFESGLAAKLFGLIPSVVFGSVITLLVVTLSSRRFPELKKLNLAQV